MGFLLVFRGEIHRRTEPFVFARKFEELGCRLPALYSRFFLFGYSLPTLSKVIKRPRSV